MPRFLTPLLAAGLAIGASLAAHAITLPSAVVTLGDGESFDFSPLFASNANGFALPNNTSHTFVDGSIVTLGSTINTASSFVSYSFGVTNANGPQTYDLNIGSGPILPKAAGSLAKSSLSVSGTDNTGFGGTIGPTGSQTTLMQSFGNGNNLGLDLGSGASLTFGDGFPDSFSGNPPATPNGFAAQNSLGSSITSLDLHLGVSVPGSGNVYSFSGSVRTTAVPEPGGLALLAGLTVPGVVGLLRRRRK